MNTRITNGARSGSAVALAVALALGLGACASAPKQSDRLDSARVTVQRAAAQGDMTGAAKTDIEMAQSNLQQAEAALKSGKSKSEVDHFAYIAEQSAQAAIARQEAVALQKKVEAAESERSAVLLEARERDAKMAQHKAETAAAEAARVQQLATAQAAALDRTQQQLAAANEQIEQLKTEKTDRGQVLTLGDVLFDSGSATLKAGADRSLEQVASHLNRNEKARLLIEGHTDSVGDDAFNQQLSEQRARSVAGRLAAMGVPNARMTATGLGESYPVTGNETAAGRQQNRRVEIIFSDNAGEFPAGAARQMILR